MWRLGVDRPMRSATAFLALVLIAAACGDDASDGAMAPVSTTTMVEVSITGPGSAVPGVDTTTTAVTVGETPTTQAPEGPGAPDFTLALGEGGTFTLSDEQKPVYMVFWAEW